MPATKLRNVRVDDELWEAALAKALAEDRSLSEVIRELLSWYIEQPPRTTRWQDLI